MRAANKMNATPHKALGLSQGIRYCRGRDLDSRSEIVAGLFDLAGMRQRLAELERERMALVDLITRAEAYEGVVGRVIRQSSSITMREVARPEVNPPARPQGAMEATEEVAASLMEAAGRPVTTSQIVVAMKQQGKPLPDKAPLNVISARMSNNKKKFVGRRGQGWWFADRPWPGEDKRFDSLLDNNSENGG